MGQIDAIRAKLLAGSRPYDLFKKEGFARTTVYATYNAMLKNGDFTGIIPNSINTGPTEDDEKLAEESDELADVTFVHKSSASGTVKRSAANPTGKTINVVNFDGSGGPSLDAVNAARGALGMAMVPSILRMPMPELLYIAMVTSISEFSWPPMQPQDFIDTVLKEWLEACDIITRPIIKRAELQEIVDKASTTPESVFKKYVAENGYVSPDQVNDLINSAVERVKHEMGGNGNGHNGNGEKHGDEQSIPTATITPGATPSTDAGAIEINIPTGPVSEKIIPVNEPTVEKSQPDVKPIESKPPIIVDSKSLQPPVINTGDCNPKNMVGSTKIQDMINSKKDITPETIIANIPDAYMWMIPRLRANGILTVGQLLTRSIQDLENLENLGDAMAKKINVWVISMGFKLREPGADFVPGTKIEPADNVGNIKAQENKGG